MTVDPERLTAIRKLVEAPKVWTSRQSMGALWHQGNQKRFPRPFSFRTTLEIGGEAMEGLFVDAWYQPTKIPGNRDKISLSLVIDAVRAIGVDDNGPSVHTNTVGRGLLHYQQTIPHPHVHFAVPDALMGYAEPITSGSAEELWTEFVRRANIVNAPAFELPPGQLEIAI